MYQVLHTATSLDLNNMRHESYRYQVNGGRSGSMSTASTQPLLVPERRRYSQQDSPAASPSTATLSPTINPWYAIIGLRTLIMIDVRNSLSARIGEPAVHLPLVPHLQYP